MKPYYHDEHAGITIYHGDCREVLPTLGPIDCLITDPPYGINVGNNASSRETRRGFLVKGGYATFDDTRENYENIIVPALTQAIGQSDRAAVFGFPPNCFLLPAPSTMGGIYVPAGCGRNCWGFTNFMPVLFYGHAPGIQNGAMPTTIRSTDLTEPNGHPTPKPIRWMTWLVGLASTESDVIVDPFMGSGTTLVASKQLGRKAIGIELNEAYAEIAAKRLAQEVLPL